MAHFRPISISQINSSLAEKLVEVLQCNHQAINPTIVCSLRAFEENIDRLSDRFDIDPHSLIYSVKAMPVKEFIDVAIARGLRILLYGRSAVDELFGINPEPRYIQRSIIGDGETDLQSARELILHRGASQFLIARLDSYQSFCDARTSYEPEQLDFYALTGASSIGKYWSNTRVIPLEALDEVVTPMTDSSSDATRFRGIFVYSGNPFTHETRAILDRSLVTPNHERLLAGKECYWGGLGKSRNDNDFELMRIMARLPNSLHGIDAGTALVYGSSALIAQARHYRFPLTTDNSSIVLEWGLAAGAHDIKYVYRNEVLDVLLVGRDGSIIDPGTSISESLVSVSGDSMASDDSNLGWLRLPRNISAQDISALIFMDAQYVMAFELKRHFLGGYHQLKYIAI